MFHMPLLIGISRHVSFAGIQRGQEGVMGYIYLKSKSLLVSVFTWSSLYVLTVFAVNRSDNYIGLPVLLFKGLISTPWFLWALLGCLVVTILVHLMKKFFGYLWDFACSGNAIA